jgi:DNA-binding NtrC family response regulator
VRELENLVERLVILSRGAWLEKKDLPPAMVRDGDRSAGEAGEKLRIESLDFRKAKEEFENGLIRQALSLSGGNRKKAATLLGLKRTTLLEMLKRKGLNGP